MENSKTSYAFFDFDGTLIDADSLQLLIRKVLKTQPWRLFLLCLTAPILASTVLFGWDKRYAKSAILWCLTVFRTKRQSIALLGPESELQKKQFFFKEAKEEFEKLRQQNIEIVVVSASGQLWVKKKKKKQLPPVRLIIGSKLRFFCGGIIFSSANCYKEEKLKRIQEHLGNNFQWHSSWSDHTADLPLLKKAPLRFVINPKIKHKTIFDNVFHQNYNLIKWHSAYKNNKGNS